MQDNAFDWHPSPHDRPTGAGELLRIQKIYHEPGVAGYARGREILSRFPGAERVEVPSHWNIPELHGNIRLRRKLERHEENRTRARDEEGRVLPPLLPQLRLRGTLAGKWLRNGLLILRGVGDFDLHAYRPSTRRANSGWRSNISLR